MKKVMTGNQAIARGFWEAGGMLAASYPGSPTVEMLESLKQYDEIYSEFSINEKVALEVAIGGSFYGARSMASMKHVGMNIAADPLLTFTQTEINGGFVLVSGSDPGMASSQNEQDNRIIGKFANMGILHPGDSQEAKEYMKHALEISEKFQMPMLVDISSRVCHSRSIVETEERVETEIKGFKADRKKYTMLPPHTFEVQYQMQDRIKALKEEAYNLSINQLYEKEGADTLVITSGLMYHNLIELDPDVSIYKLGMVYPISEKRIKELAKKYERIIVLEEMMPFIENELTLMGVKSQGKEFFSFTGELHIEDIKKGLEEAGLLKETGEIKEVNTPVVPRPPMFCAGCPHRPVFDVLKKSKVRVMGDIGCYSMAAFDQWDTSDTIISMGATVGITKGMNKMMRKNGDSDPIVSVIGDGTFFHSGMTGFVNLLHQMEEDDNMTFIILENSTTAMTGGQHSASSGNFNHTDDMHVNIKDMLTTIGFENIREVDQFDYKDLKETIKEETSKKGTSIIIATRPCALRYKIVEKNFFVDPKVCIGCRTCIKTNCPPIRMKEYQGIDKLKSFIDPDMCVGCSVCAQVCPVGAIKRSQ